MTDAGGVVDQVHASIAIPVDGAEGLGPVFIPADDTVIDHAAIDQC